VRKGVSFESPQHRVRIAEPFTVMEAEVTLGAFTRFVQETGYKPGEGCFAGSGKDWQPDANVTGATRL
jgi:formylglycine-generating enzyme required for sulfatase activity